MELPPSPGDKIAPNPSDAVTSIPPVPVTTIAQAKKIGQTYMNPKDWDSLTSFFRGLLNYVVTNVHWPHSEPDAVFYFGMIFITVQQRISVFQRTRPNEHLTAMCTEMKNLIPNDVLQVPGVVDPLSYIRNGLAHGQYIIGENMLDNWDKFVENDTVTTILNRYPLESSEIIVWNKNSRQKVNYVLRMETKQFVLLLTQFFLIIHKHAKEHGTPDSGDARLIREAGRKKIK